MQQHYCQAPSVRIIVRSVHVFRGWNDFCKSRSVTRKGNNNVIL